MRALNDNQLGSLLDGDIRSGDLTTHSLRPARLEFRTRPVCASEEAQRLCEPAGRQARLLLRSGSHAGADALILEAQGDAASLHLAWKTAQNLVEWASGIASATAAIVAVENGPGASGVAVACTRKNVRGGGGIMQRLGLSETVLVFAEHRLFLNTAPPRDVQVTIFLNA